MRLSFVALGLLAAGLAGCRREAASAAPSPVEPVLLEPSPDLTPDITPAPALDPTRKLSLRHEGSPDDFAETCSIVDEATNQVLGRASGRGGAAGGTRIECIDIVGDGKAIVFRNTRAHFAVDARIGRTNGRHLGCSIGAYANDLSSCVDLDRLPILIDPDVARFDLQLHDETKNTDRVLVSIAKPWGRFDRAKGEYKPRWWDAKYCANDRVLVVANGFAHLFEAPSGRLLGKARAPEQTRVTSCDGSRAETKGREPTGNRSFTITRTALTPL